MRVEKRRRVLALGVGPGAHLDPLFAGHSSAETPLPLDPWVETPPSKALGVESE